MSDFLERMASGRETARGRRHGHVRPSPPEGTCMILRSRLALAPVLAVAAAGLTMPSALAASDPLTTDAVGALAVASCQLDPAAPLSLEELAPVVVGEADVDVVPGEITAHVVRAEVNTAAGGVQQCTFGVLHRDALLAQVKYDGT